MWSKLKKNIIERILRSWIVSSDDEENNINDNEFLNLKNVKLNSENLNSTLNKLTDCQFKIVTGKIDELSVQINWTEILSYWTSIQAKYNTFDELETASEQRFELGCPDEKNEKESIYSYIKITNLRLEMEFINSNLSSDSSTSIENRNLRGEFTENVLKELKLLESSEIININLMADFIKHIFGQFKVEIEGINIYMKDQQQIQWILVAPRLMIQPEFNGIRKITVIQNDIKISGPNLDLNIQKGTEMTLFYTIEAFKIKLNVPGVDFRTSCIDLESLSLSLCGLGLELLGNTKSEKYPIARVFFEFFVDSFKIKIGKLSLIAHDLMMSSGDDSIKKFILGHFQVRWNEQLVIDSPVQTHCITGNMIENSNNLKINVNIEEFMSLKATINQIRDIIDFFTFRTNNESKIGPQINGEMYKIYLRGLKLQFNDYISGLQFQFENLCLRPNFIDVNSVQIKYSSSEIVLQNIHFTKSQSSPNTFQDYKSHFSELIRYIENDQIIPLQDQKELYNRYQTRLDKLEIRNLTGEINAEDMNDMIKVLNNQIEPKDKFEDSSAVIELIGNVGSINIKVKLNESVNYSLGLESFDFLKTNQVLDFRCRSLESLARNSLDIFRSEQISFTLAEGLGALEVLNIICTIPHDFFHLIKGDLDSLFCNESLFGSIHGRTNANVNNINFQLTFRNINLTMTPPGSISSNLLIPSRLLIKEINAKLTGDTIVYLDEGILVINDQSIFRSGLLKFNRIGFEQMEVRNYCSEMNLRSKDLQNLLKFIEFLSEVYSPVIKPIEPEAIFHDSVEIKSIQNRNVLEGATLIFNENESDKIENAVNNKLELELEFEFSASASQSEDEDNESRENKTESCEKIEELKVSNNDQIHIDDQETAASYALKELLNEIDDKFFVSKIENYSNIKNGVKIKNFGIKVNLILDIHEHDNSNRNFDIKNVVKEDNSNNDNDNNNDTDSHKDNPKYKNNEIITLNLDGIDGFISSELIDLKIKDGNIEKTRSISESKYKKIILSRWNCGPDLTSKYPIEDGNLVSIRAEKIIKNLTKSIGIDEFNLNLSICPLRLFLDQKSLSTLRTFFNQLPAQSVDEFIVSASINTKKEIRSFIFFNKVNISSLALKLDYKPNALDGNENAPIPLEGAEMVLPRAELRGIKGFHGLGPAILNAWIPELKGKKLTGVIASGLVPVRTIINLGGGMVELILLPWQSCDQRSAARTAANLRRSSKKIGLETLKLTASLANHTTKLLNSADSEVGPRYPRDFQSGLQQAAQLIIALPTKINDRKRGKSAVRAMPLVILDSAGAVSGALAKTLQGLQVQFDRELGHDRKIKRN